MFGRIPSLIVIDERDRFRVQAPARPVGVRSPHACAHINAYVLVYSGLVHLERRVRPERALSLIGRAGYSINR